MIALIKTTIVGQIRNPKYIIFLAIFPIILTLLIGGLIGNSMDGAVKIEHKTVYYMDNGNTDTSKILEITSGISDKSGSEFTFKKIDSKSEGINYVSNKSQIFIDVEGANINIYATKNDNVYYNYLHSMLSGISKSVDAVSIVAKNDPVFAQKLIKGTSDYKKANVEMISKSQTPTGFDYYGVAELTMIVMYIISFPLSRYYDDKENKIDQRIKLAGISNFKYITGNTIGFFILSFAITLPSFLFSKYVLSVNWGADPLLCYGIIQIFSLASILIGTVISFLISDKEKANGIIQGIILPLFSFLGGAYIALSNNSLGNFGFILDISPLRWINKAIFSSIYQGNNTLLIESGLIYLGVSVVLVIVLVVMFKKGDDRI